MERVQKLLSNFGYCSRRKAEELIMQGKVKVNGKIISIGDKASYKDKITVNNKLVKREKKVYLKFYKPLKCVTALSDKEHKTVMDYINIKERVFPVGRLDYNTSGILLLTNDGDLANKIMHPRYEIKKTYAVEINKPIEDSTVKKIEKGIVLADGKTSKAYVRKINDNLVEIKIHEGKNRVVRRIFENFEIKVISLKRTKIGRMGLKDLKPGQYEKITMNLIKKDIL